MPQTTQQTEPPKDGLSPAQRSAVEHDSGPLIVLAGPGTGKTRVITHRVAHMIRERGIEPESIVAVTFTVKAAEQMRDRLRELVGTSAADRVWASTFHALGLRVLHRFGDTLAPTKDAAARDAARRVASEFRARGRGGGGAGWGARGGGLIDSAQQARLLRRIVRDLDLYRPSRAFGLNHAVELASRQISLWNEMAVAPEHARAFAALWRERLAAERSSDDEPADETTLKAERERLAIFEDGVRAFAVYESALRELGLVSFADLINLPTRMLNDPASRAGAIVRSEWRHVVVDEFQDANPAQIEMLRALAPPSPTHPPDLCVVGDDDQSIYGFRGADDRAFTRMDYLWGESVGAKVSVVELSDNYRSAAPIVELASGVISRAHSRFKPDKVVTPAKSAPASSVGVGVLGVALPDDAFDASAIAAMVRLHAHQAAPPSEGNEPPTYAVVVRSNSHIAPITTALRQEGIAVRTSFVERAADDPAVQDVLAWCRVLIDPSSTAHARRLLARPPLRWTPEVVGRLERSFAAALEAEAPQAQSGYLAFIASRPESELGPGGAAAINRLVDLQARLTVLAAAEPAAEVVRATVTASGVSHAELLSPTDRAGRVRALVALLRFAADVQPRLDEPGDLRSLLAYYDDLSDSDQGLGSSGAWGDIEERLDGPRDRDEQDSEQDAPSPAAAPVVNVLTAHKAKGLEFDVVFVPRLGRTVGQYAFAGRSDDDGAGDGIMPPGLMAFVHPGERGGGSPAERAQDEARRIFYVACTRAKRRLVLLARRLKGKSSGVHFFEEVEEHERPNGLIEIVGFNDVMQQASREGVLHATSADDADMADSAGDTQDLLNRARRETRLLAAEALDQCEHTGALTLSGPESESLVEEAIDRLSLAARRMQAIGALLRRPADPHASGDVFVQRLARRLRAQIEPSDAGEGTINEGMPMHMPGLTPPLRLSYSAIDSYLRCPRCFYLQRVLGLPEQEGVPEIVGQVVHKAIELFTRSVRSDEADLRELEAFGFGEEALAAWSTKHEERLLAIGRHVFDKHWPADEPVDREQIARIDILLRNFLDEYWRPDDHTLEVERRITFDYTPQTVDPIKAKLKKGRKSSDAAEPEKPAAPITPKVGDARPHVLAAVIDRIDQVAMPDGSAGARIVDYKTGPDWKKLTSPANDDLQMGIYAMALASEQGVEPTELRGTAEYWLVAGRTRGVLDLSQIRYDKVRAKIDHAIAGMLAGDFPIGKEHLNGRQGIKDCLIFEPDRAGEANTP